MKNKSHVSLQRCSAVHDKMGSLVNRSFASGLDCEEHPHPEQRIWLGLLVIQ